MKSTSVAAARRSGSPSFSAGSTAVLLLRAAADPHPVGSASIPKGGLGALTKALADSARAAGAEIRTQADVQHIRIKNNAVTGIVLADGEEIATEAVVSGVDPKRTLFNLVDPSQLDPTFALRIKNIRAAGNVAKINFALNRLPTFPALADSIGPDGAMYLILREGNKVYSIDAKRGLLKRIAGTGAKGYGGDGGAALDCTWNGPKGIAFRNNRAYVLDTGAGFSPRVQVYNTSTAPPTYDTMAATAGSNPDNLYIPSDVEVNSFNGHIYVTNDPGGPPDTVGSRKIQCHKEDARRGCLESRSSPPRG